jgi:hypothetical protein
MINSWASPTTRKILGLERRKRQGDDRGGHRQHGAWRSARDDGGPPELRHCRCIFLGCGISSTHHIARFWRLHESLVEVPDAAALVSAPIQILPDGRAFVIAGAAAEGSLKSAEASLAKRAERQTHHPFDPNAVIAAAFKTAGLAVPEIPTAPSGAMPRVAPSPIIAAALKAAGLVQS